MQNASPHSTHVPQAWRVRGAEAGKVCNTASGGPAAAGTASATTTATKAATEPTLAGAAAADVANLMEPDFVVMDALGVASSTSPTTVRVRKCCFSTAVLLGVHDGSRVHANAVCSCFDLPSPCARSTSGVLVMR